MNKSELIADVATKAEITKKDADAAVNAVIEAITESLKKGDKVQLVGFGTFEVRERGARTGRDPRTNQEIKIPASKARKVICQRMFCRSGAVSGPAFLYG